MSCRKRGLFLTPMHLVCMCIRTMSSPNPAPSEASSTVPALDTPPNSPPLTTISQSISTPSRPPVDAFTNVGQRSEIRHRDV